MAPREGSVEGDCYCPLFQIDKLRFRVFPECLQVVSQVQWAAGSGAQIPGPQRHQRMLGAGGHAGGGGGKASDLWGS